MSAFDFSKFGQRDTIHKDFAGRPTKHLRAFNVYLPNRGLIDTVFYSAGDRITCEEVRKSLINHDGYDNRIFVQERK